MAAVIANGVLFAVSGKIFHSCKNTLAQIMKLIIFILFPVFASAQSNSLKYQWRKVSGPAQYTILSPKSATTKIINLTQGIYKFELKVTNRYNLSARDTMTLTVKAPVSKPVTANVSKPGKVIYIDDPEKTKHG